MRPKLYLCLLWVCCAVFSQAQVYLLDEQFNGAPAVPPTLIATGPAFGAINSISNFGRNAPSLQLNTTGQTLIFGPYSSNADLISFYHKGTSGAGSTILVTESVDGVTWTNVATVTAITTAATFVGSLQPASRYVRLSFTQIPGCNIYLDDLRIRAQTDLCQEPLNLLQVLINGGCGTCEGSEEFLYFETGGSTLDIRYFELVSQTVTAGGNAYGGNGPTDNSNTNWVQSANYTASQTNYINNLNAWANCPGVFVPVPANNVIPAYARVLAFTGATPTATYNFDQLCALGTVYVIFANQTDCGGKYSNSSCSSNCTRYITLFNHQTGCVDNNPYLANSTSTTAGNGYIFVAPNIGYTSTANCAFLVLGVEFKDIRCENREDIVAVEWETSMEEDLMDMSLQWSSDAKTWSTIFGADPHNDLAEHTYTWQGKLPIMGTAYFRVKATDFNGEVFLSDVCATQSNLAQLTRIDQQLWVHGNDTKDMDLVISNSLGQEEYRTTIFSEDAFLDLSWLPRGIHFIALMHDRQPVSIKWIQD